MVDNICDQLSYLIFSSIYERIHGNLFYLIIELILFLIILYIFVDVLMFYIDELFHIFNFKLKNFILSSSNLVINHILSIIICTISSKV